MVLWLERVALLLVLFAVSGCGTQYVGLWEAEQNRFLYGADNLEQVSEAIVEGATNAGWTVLKTSEHLVQVSRKIRVHTVTIDIRYSKKQYIPRYSSSIGMKIQCTQSEVSTKRHRVSGLEDCPGGRAPYYIHKNYKVWLDELLAEIENSLIARNLAK